MRSLQTWFKQIGNKLGNLYTRSTAVGWLKIGRVHSLDTFYSPRGSCSNSTMDISPWEVHSGKAVLLLIVLFLPVGEIGRLHWIAYPSSPPFWRLHSKVPHGKTCNTDLMTFKRWLHNNPGNFLLFFFFLNFRQQKSL